MAVSQWFNMINCRNPIRSGLDPRMFRNSWLIGGLLCGILLQFLVIYIEPLNLYFHTTPIPLAGSRVDHRAWQSGSRS
ncbi:MAG: cation transporting ATPase C-terminal domain-containing protein [Chthoniobacterales bacterium]